MRNILIKLFLCITLAATSWPAFSSINIGQPEPSLKVTELDGKWFDLEALKTKVVIIHFWATWCESCREEMPVLESFYQSHHNEGLEVLAMSIDNPRSRHEVEAVMRGFHFPAALVSDANVNDFGTIRSIPATYVIDKSGTILSILTPNEALLTTEKLNSMLLPLLSK